MYITEAWGGKDPKGEARASSHRPASATSAKSTTRPEITAAPVRAEIKAAETEEKTTPGDK